MCTAMNEAAREAMRKAAFLKRTGKPKEMAETVLYLLSECSSFVTGQTLIADGVACDGGKERLNKRCSLPSRRFFSLAFLLENS